MTGDIDEPPTELDSIARFLPDEPLASDAKDVAEFGHRGVAETLATIVRRCDPPFTIALFGSWGTGKSSVVELLRGRLNPTIPTVVVDVWKFQDDSLRRTVLKELVDSGPSSFPAFVKSVTLSERVEAAASLETEFKIGLLPGQLDKALKWAAPARLVPLVLTGIALNALAVVWFAPRFPSPIAQTAALVLGVFSFVGAMGFLLVPKRLTVSKGRFDDPYDFQKEFNDVISKGYAEAERVLIVFDNLDRVDNKKAVEVLTTIKTFLESRPGKGKKPKTVFLVPCDDDAIREQVQERFHDGDEFLRKFFNVSVRLPEFIGTELEGYALQLLTQTRVPALRSPQVAWMITKAFQSNPRQVKQFINVLVAEYLLVNRRSTLKELPPSFAEENVLTLTLFELLRTRFPEALAFELGRKPEHTEAQEQARLELQCEEMKAFREEVNHYAAISDFRPWLTLRSSKYEVNLPGVDDFLLALTYADLKEAERFLVDIKDYPSAQNDLSCAIQDRAGATKETTFFVEFLSTLLNVLGPEKRVLNGTTMDQLLGRASRLVKYEAQLAVAQLDPLLISDRLEERGFGHSDFVDAWTKVLKGAAQMKELAPKRDFLVHLVEVLASHDDWFEDHWAEIAELLPAVVGKDDELLRILAEGESAATWIDSSVAYAFADHMAAPAEVVGALPESVLVADPEAFAKRVELLGMLPPTAIDEVVAGRVLRADAQVMDGSINSEADGDVWLSLVTTCRSSLTIVAAGVTEGGIEDVVLNDFTRVVKTVLNSSQNPAAQREAILTLVDLGNTGHHPDRNALVGFVNTYVASAPVEDVRTIVAYMGGPSLEGWPECKETLLQRCVAETELYDAVLEDTEQERRYDWMFEMLPKRPAHVLNSVGVSGLSEEEIVCLCEYADEPLRDLSSEDLIAVLDAISPLLGLPGMGYALDTYTAALGRLLTSGDETLASAGIRLLRAHPEHLADPGRACGLVSELMTWLGPVGEKYQPSAIGAILVLGGRLTKEEADSLIGILFDTATNDSRPEAVEHAIRSLAALDVKYDERPANFVHLQTRYKSTEDEAMRSAIREGLTALRPNQTPRKNRTEARAFWDWQKSLG